MASDWQFMSHLSMRGVHSCADRHLPTGIIREANTTFRNDRPVGPARVCYWHPKMPKSMTVPTFEEAIAWLEAQRKPDPTREAVEVGRSVSGLALPEPDENDLRDAH